MSSIRKDAVSQGRKEEAQGQLRAELDNLFRRRLSAEGAKSSHTIDRKRTQVMFVVFQGFIDTESTSETKVVPYGRVVDNTLLRHFFSAAVFPAREWHAIVVPIGLTSQGNCRHNCT